MDLHLAGKVVLLGRASGLTKEKLAHLGSTMGMSNVISRFHATFRTEVDPQTREALAPTCPLAYPNVPED